MSETAIHVRGEGGAVFRMELPLSPHIRERYEAGDIVRVNADGSEWTDGQPKRKMRARTPTTGTEQSREAAGA